MDLYSPRSFPKVVRPSLVTYDEVQLDRVSDTIKAEEAKIQAADKEKRQKVEAESTPSLQEGVKVAALSAVIESSFALATRIYHKLREGKKLHDFTVDDWKDIGLDTALGAVKGGIRGGGIYTLSNFAGTPTPVASALFSAMFGMIAQANKLSKGSISVGEFLDNCEVLCLDVSVSALCSIVGQTVIPIPVLGTVIGNAAGMFMYDIGKTFLSEKEQKLFERFNSEIYEYQLTLDGEYQELPNSLNEQLAKFSSLIELAFDENINMRVISSIERARFVGVPEEHILTSEDVAEQFFLSSEPFYF